MAKELFAGQRKNKYKIVISKEAISRKNIAPLLIASFANSFPSKFGPLIAK